MKLKIRVFFASIEPGKNKKRLLKVYFFLLLYSLLSCSNLLAYNKAL